MGTARALLACAACALAACGDDGGSDGHPDAGAPDGASGDAAVADASGGADSGGDGDGGGDAEADAATNAPDAGAMDPDAGAMDPDAAAMDPDAAPDAMTGVITGGPCLSGAAGATAYRVRWLDGGGTAYVQYEVNGLPDTSRDHTGAYGYTIPYTPPFVDPFLGEGGLHLSSSNFVDIEISTLGVSQIDTATLSIYGRSYNTTTSGSFTWMTFSGFGAAPTNLVSNVAPYEWYSADMTTEIDPNDGGVLIRIEAGPLSNSLVVHRIEICMQAQ